MTRGIFDLVLDLIRPCRRHQTAAVRLLHKRDVGYIDANYYRACSNYYYNGGAHNVVTITAVTYRIPGMYNAGTVNIYMYMCVGSRYYARVGLRTLCAVRRQCRTYSVEDVAVLDRLIGIRVVKTPHVPLMAVFVN